MPTASATRPGETLVRLDVGESGKHGAVRIQRAVLIRQDSSILAKTPADTALRELAVATNPAVTSVVQSAPTYGAGAGTGGKDIYTIAVANAEGANFTAGGYVRATVGAGGVYQIDTIAGDNVKVFAGQNELDIANGNTIETVVPAGVYGTAIEVSYADLTGQSCTLEIELVGQAAASRANKPALAVAVDDRKLDSYWPDLAASSIKVY